MLGLDRRFIYISPAVEKVTGYTPEEVKEMSLERFLDPETVYWIEKKLLEELGKPQKERIPFGTLEYRQRRKDGRLVDIEVGVVIW